MQVSSLPSLSLPSQFESKSSFLPDCFLNLVLHNLSAFFSSLGFPFPHAKCCGNQPLFRPSTFVFAVSCAALLFHPQLTPFHSFVIVGPFMLCFPCMQFFVQNHWCKCFIRWREAIADCFHRFHTPTFSLCWIHPFQWMLDKVQVLFNPILTTLSVIIIEKLLGFVVSSNPHCSWK